MARARRLLLLARGGKTVFFGTTGQHSEALIRYFEAVPGTPKHNGTQNPATWMLPVLGTCAEDLRAAGRKFGMRRGQVPGFSKCQFFFGIGVNSVGHMVFKESNLFQLGFLHLISNVFFCRSVVYLTGDFETKGFSLVLFFL